MATFLRNNLTSRIALAAFLTVGVLAVWGIVGGLFYSMTAPASSSIHEYLQITPDGKLLIAQLRPGATHYTYRTVDGQPIEKPKGFIGGINLASLPFPAEERLVPTSLSRLIVGSSDGAAPATFWYLVHDGQAAGHAYLVGYNSESKQLVGYIGQKGFRTELPPAGEQFAMDRTFFVNGSNYYSAGGSYTGPGHQPSISPYSDAGIGVMFVISAGKLSMIDLATRSVSIVPTPDNVLSLSATYEPYVRLDGAEAQAGTNMTVAVRTERDILFLNQHGKQTKLLHIPEKLLRQSIGLTNWWTRTPMYISDYWGQKGATEVHWFDIDGKEIDHVTVHLTRGSPESPQSIAWTLAVFCPAPTIAAFFFFFFMPVSLAFAGRSETIAAALNESIAAGWPAFVALCSISIVMSVVCYRRHRKYNETGAAAWAMFILLAGPLGYVGYLLHRHWPPMEHCQHCHQLSPRDRDTCLHCLTPFPTPPLKGIEIFA